MNAPVKAQVTETEQIVFALDALLTAAITADRDKPLTPSRGLTSAGVMVGEFLNRLKAWTPIQREAEEYLARPVSWALRRAVRVLGKRLHEIGGEDLMHDVCDRVAAMDPANDGRRASIMDHRWDGIGNWFA